MKPKPVCKNTQRRTCAKQISQKKKKINARTTVAYATKTTIHAINQYNTVHKQKHAAVNKQRKYYITQSTHSRNTIIE
jgi:hypothetical protein